MDLLLPSLGLLLLGIAVGIVSAALGIGGGVLMVPAFATFIAGMDLNTAKGSSLFLIMFVAAENAWQQWRRGVKSPWDVVGLMAAGSVVFGYLGAWVTGKMSETVVTWIFVALLGFVGIRTFFIEPRHVREDEVRKRRVLSILIGAGAGVVGGATGTGGGAVLVPFALWAGIASNERVVALSNTVMVATAAAGSLGHLMSDRVSDLPYTYGLVNFAVAPMVFLGALIGSPMGRVVNAKLTLGRRRVVMGTVLLVIAVRLIYRVMGE